MEGIRSREIADAGWPAQTEFRTRAAAAPIPELPQAKLSRPWSQSFAGILRRHGEALLVAVLIAAWLAATAWARPLTLPDEGRYVSVAWEMLRSGDWLTPTLDGLPFFHKPPLFYWITAGSLATFGLNAWAARAAPLLGGFVAAFSLYLFQRRWSGRGPARHTVVMLLVQPLFFAGAQFANLDMLVAGCITATVVLLAHAALCIESGLPHARPLLGAYATAALGVLAKGLIGAVVPALVIVLWLATLRDWHTLRRLVRLAGIALFAGLVLPWFMAMQSRFDGFFDYFFVVQHFRRFAGNGFNNAEPFWFYPAVLSLLSLPSLPWLYRLIRHGRASEPAARDLRGLLWAWTGAVVIFFSWPHSKLVGYVLPAVPPLAALFAEGRRAPGGDGGRQGKAWWASVAVSAAIGLSAVAYFAVQPTASTREVAATLASLRAAEEPVFMLNQYYYDVPFEAHLRQPVGVVDEWSGPDVDRRDNWRKELADAGRFAPTRAPSMLVRPDALPTALCSAPVSWAIGPATAVSSYPFLAHADTVLTRRATTLWRIDASRPETAAALRCATTIDGAPGMLPIHPAAVRRDGRAVRR